MLLKEPKIYLFGRTMGVPKAYHPHDHHYIVIGSYLNSAKSSLRLSPEMEKQ
tara:strand:+ start:157 stop:312 length:156 start_codon:yes stop_codon:yes gene_type:complete